MKKAILILLSVLFLLSFAGCGKNSDESETKIYKQFSGFSEGLSWVKYVDEKSQQEYYGCIDEKGKMKFSYSGDTVRPLEPWSEAELYYTYLNYENGFAYLEGKDTGVVYVIDNNGDVCADYNRRESAYSAFGYGLVVTYEECADFDSKYYEYKIIDTDKNVLETLKFSREADVEYCGEGVFDFGTKMYFAKSAKTIDFSYEWVYNQSGIFFYNGYAYVKGFPEDYLIDTMGNVTVINFPDEIKGFEVMNTRVYDDSVLLYDDSNNKIASYNLKTKAIYYLDNESVTERFFESEFSDSLGESKFNESGVAIVALGEDKYRYAALYDYTFEQKTDLIAYNDCDVFENGLCKIGTDCYDMETGEVVFSFLSYEDVIIDSKDILFVRGKKGEVVQGESYYEGGSNVENPYEKSTGKCGFAAMDKTGNIMFDKIDTSEVSNKNIFD